jgi:hypothetical protein
MSNQEWILRDEFVGNFDTRERKVISSDRRDNNAQMQLRPWGTVQCSKMKRL